MIRRGIGVQSFVSAGVSTDADAQAFITAAGITDATQQSAINTLVTDLKGYGIWTKMKAIYPFVGGTSSTHKWNLKDPRDLDAAFRLVFSGGWTHSSTGALPNGTNGYADTFLIPNSSLTINSSHLSFYSRTNTNTGYELACQDDQTVSNKTAYMGCRVGGSFVTSLQSNDANRVIVSNSNGTGFYTGTRTSSTSLKTYKNGVLQGTNTNTSVNAQSEIKILLSAFNYKSGIGVVSVNNYSAKECAFASIGDGLTDTEAANLYTSVQKYQTTLGRHVGTPIVADSDAQAFLNAAEITSVTEANAVDKLVTDLKTYGIWSKMKAIYPFVGGTSSTHKWNLKDPRDLDAAFRLVFNGGGTHSSTGYQPNGVNGYGNTYFNPNLNITSILSAHASIYSRTQSRGGCDLSVQISGRELTISADLNLIGIYAISNIGDQYAGNLTANNSTGFFIGNRQSATNNKIIRNTTTLATQTTASGSTKPNGNIYIGAQNQNSSLQLLSNRECAFASIGDGLTDTEAANLYTAVQAYQTSLSRNV